MIWQPRPFRWYIRARRWLDSFDYLEVVRAGWRLTQRVSGTIKPVVKAGFRLSALVSGTVKPTLRAGWRLTAVVIGTPAKPIVRAGWRLTQRVSGTVKPLVKAGWRLTQRVSGTAKPSAKVGYNVVQTEVVLNRTEGATSAVEYDVVGEQDWRDPGNATGNANGIVATIGGDPLFSNNGGIRLSYPSLSGKDALTIELVEVHFYAKQSGVGANPGTYRMGIETSAGRTVLATEEGNFDYLASPRVFDVTTHANTWALFNSLKTFVEFESQIPEQQVGDLDAVYRKVRARSVEAV